MKKHHRCLRVLIAMCVLTSVESASSADFPNRPVTIISPYAAGGAGEALTRTIADKLSTRWGQTVIVDNRPGAGSTIGTAVAAKARPDGYTLLLTGTTLTISAAIYPQLTYEVERDFVPISLIASHPFVLTVRKDLAVNTLADLLALARGNPGKLNFGSSGHGTMAHLAAELLRQSTKIDVVHVPFKGGAPASNALVAGQIDFMFETPTTAIPQAKAGNLKLVAVTSASRSFALPDMPTIAESGVTGYDLQIWYGLFAPKNTPEAILREVHDATRAVLADEDVIKKLAVLGMAAQSSTPTELEALVRKEMPLWKDVVQRANIKPE